MHPSLVLATLTGTVASGLLLRSAQLVPQGAAATLLSLCTQLTLPALLLHTLPPALDAALDGPFFALLPAIGVAHLLAVTVRWLCPWVAKVTLTLTVTLAIGLLRPLPASTAPC
jgi:predicted permease